MQEAVVLSGNLNPNTDVPDATLILRARNGDARAFRTIVERYQSQIAPTVVHMLGAGAEADEVGQEVFIRFYRSMHQYRGEVPLGGYLHRIAVNLSLNAIKRRKRWYERFKSLDTVQSGAEPAVEDQPEVEFSDRLKLIHDAIQQLRPKLRAVAVLRLIQEMSTRETADILGIPVGTVLSRLSRAQAKLRVMLDPYLEK